MFNDINLSGVRCPCKDCNRRNQTCDTNCKQYQKFKIELIEYRRQEHIKNIMRRKI